MAQLRPPLPPELASKSLQGSPGAAARPAGLSQARHSACLEERGERARRKKGVGGARAPLTEK